MGVLMTSSVGRRQFVTAAGTFGLGAVLAPGTALAWGAGQSVAGGAPSPVRLGLASYTFRNFSRAQLIGFMQELHLDQLNPKDAKDHLPQDPAGEAEAV